MLGSLNSHLVYVVNRLGNVTRVMLHLLPVTAEAFSPMTQLIEIARLGNDCI